MAEGEKVIRMELVVKLPENKPPFLGILFDDSYQACSINKSAVNNYHTCTYQIVLEPTGEKLNLRLICESFGLNYVYENIKYNPETLIKFVYKTKDSKLFNFSHLVRKDGKDTVVKTLANQRLFVLKIYNLSVNEEL